MLMFGEKHNHEMPARNLKCAGFTMVELISVMVIVGILAAVALPRFFNRTDFDTRSFYDQTLAILRYAQKTAVAQRRLVCVAFTTSSVSLTIASANPGACNINLAGPTGTAPYTVTSPSTGVVYTTLPVDFNFTALGQPSAAPGLIKITSPDGPSGLPDITVEPETGYVR